MELYNATKLYGTVRFSLQQDFNTSWTYTTEVSLRLLTVCQGKRRKKHCWRSTRVHLSVFMLITGLRVHFKLFQEFQTLTIKKN